MKTYATVYFGSALLALVLTPLVSRLANAIGLVDPPGVRKVHTKPVPRVGGVVFVVSALLLVIPALFLDNVIGQAFRKVQVQFVTLLAAGVFIFVVGLVDDIRSLPALLKLVALLAAAAAVCGSGARIETITVDDWFVLRLGWGAWPLTLMWITAVTVGMNFIDGLDGLAAGISAIVCATIAVFALHSGQIAMFVLMLALLGSLCGFLVFNFSPARIFMGDGGSMFIGFMIGGGSVVCQAKSATLVGIALPALALGVPIFDTVLTVVRRAVLDRRSIFAGEVGHIHHRLLAKGLTQRGVVVLMYGVTLVAAGIGTLMMVMRQGAQVAVLAGGALFLLLVFQLAGSIRLKETRSAIRRCILISRQRREEKSSFEDAQLRIRRVNSLAGWWDAVCRLSEKMGFERLILWWSNGDGTTHTLIWRRCPQSPMASDVIHVTIPVANGHPDWRSQMELAVSPNGSLEGTGRRVALLGRLLDEGNFWAYADLAGPVGPRPRAS